MSCAEGVLGHVEAVNIHYSCFGDVQKPPQLVAAQEPSANEHWQGERFYGERLGGIAWCYVFEISKIIDNVMVY